MEKLRGNCFPSKLSITSPMWTNYHSHSYYCDGKDAPAAHLAQAMARGFLAFGCSSHAPLPFETSWNMKAERFAAYCEEVRAAAAAHQGGMEVYLGVEVDFIPGVMGPGAAVLAPGKLDYTVGSIHFVDQFPDGRPWEVDGRHKLFLEGLDTVFGGDAQRAVSRYFALTRQMLREAPPTLLGHMDKIKIQDEGGKLFSERAAWYEAELMATLEELAGSEVMLEINTRGMYKGLWPEPYPSYWVIERAHAMGIPLVLNADSHLPTEVDLGFGDVAQRLQAMGIPRLYALLGGQWQALDVDEHGLKRP